jgi:plastocyanin
LKLIGILILSFLCSNAATGATITGKVKILTDKGKAYEDSSGVVVFLDGLKAPPTSPKDVTIVQKNKSFVPNVLAVPMGTTVHFPNEDSILHNVFSLSKSNPFDLGLYKKGKSKSATFKNPGLVKVFCNIHERMYSHVLVTENPFSAVTDSEGNFEIKDVPQGKFELVAWHRLSEPNRKPITLSSDGKLQIGFDLVRENSIVLEIRADKEMESHLNKWGQPYKEKY